MQFQMPGLILRALSVVKLKVNTKMLRRSRDEAINRMKKEAEKMDADAVVMMRFDNGSIGKDMQSVVAYGTAVKYID